MNRDDWKTIYIGLAAVVVGGVMAVGLMMAEVWIKRDIMGVPYCISGK